MAASFEIELTDAVAPLVLALDVGSTATRGMVYDARSRPVGKRAKVPHSFTVARDGTSEIDPDQVLAEITEVIDKLTKDLKGEQIAGVGLDTFASSLVVLDQDGAPLTPCYTYADGRCGSHVESLRQELIARGGSEEELQQQTGTRVHSSYWPARLRWLAEQHPDVVDSAAHYVSLGDYVLAGLTGVLATGTSTAAWTGLVDRRTADWSPQVAELAGISVEQLPPIHHLDEPLQLTTKQSATIADTWPALAQAQWFAPVADGLAANVGLGASDETSIGASCATSGALRVLVRNVPEELPAGLWCYAVSHDRALLGGALNDVGRALAWADVTLRTDQVEEEELSAALSAEPHETTPLVLPFFTGERSTGWASNARAVISGVGLGSAPVETYRGVVEGIALSYARIAAQLRRAAPQPERLYCGGRVTTDRPELLQMMADAMRTSVTPVQLKRTTLRGTALLMLETIAPGVKRATPDLGPALEPNLKRRPYYSQRFGEFEKIYQALFAAEAGTGAGTQSG